MSIKVSIVITCYNDAEFIEGAINSVVNQEYENSLYEIIIVDDGSSDESVNIIHRTIKDLGDKVKCSVFVKENGGTASARNLGVKESSGEFIGFLDADDEYLPLKIAKSIDSMSFGPNIGIVYSDYITKRSDSDHSLTMKFPFSWDFLMQECIISTNSFIAKQAWIDVGGFDETISIIEDYDLWLRICLKGYMARHIPEHLFVYNDRDGNKTNTEKKNGLKVFNLESKRIKDRILGGNYYVHYAK